MTKREFLKSLGLFLLGIFSYLFIKPLLIVSRPPKRRILISEEEYARLSDVYLGEEFILVKTNEGALAFSRRCPHLGCRLNFAPEEELIVCPCHQSKFTIFGKFLSGPARRDLQPLTVQKTERGFQVEI